MSPEDNALIDNTVSVDKAGWVSKVNIAKGTTDPRVEFILPK